MHPISKKRFVAALGLIATASMAGFSACIPGVELPPPLNPTTTETILRWNQIAVDTSGLDHTPVGQDESREFGHQLGPGRSARAMAIVHIAIFDVVNALSGSPYEPYTDVVPPIGLISQQAAIAQAAHDTLVALFPSHGDRLDDELAEDLDSLIGGDGKSNGIAFGRAAAAAVLAMRENDGSDSTVDYVFSDQPGHWRSDPMNPGQQPLGEEWKNVAPFVLSSADQFRAPPMPAMTTEEYAEAFNEVKELGGDGVTTPTNRTADQTEAGIYWAYDGTPSLCAPPRLYNQLTVHVATQEGINAAEMARLLALVNVAMSDAGVAIWESKFYYDCWRPVTGIREADVGMGPSGLGDNNADTVADPNFVPLGAPLSNGSGPNFTPPFPAYPSGHAGFGGSLFQILRRFFGTDDITFTFVSDELNGVTLDNNGAVRPLKPRTFTSFSQAEEENGQSRIYLGIHWSFDKVEGIVQGNKVADYVFDNAFQLRD